MMPHAVSEPPRHDQAVAAALGPVVRTRLVFLARRSVEQVAERL